MKKSVLLFLAVLCIVFCSTFGGCQTIYQPQYALADCSVTISEQNNNTNSITFTKQYTSANFTLYFENNSENTQSDEWINRFSTFHSLLSNIGIKNTFICYISNQLIANYQAEQGTTITVSFPIDTEKEEALAWLLRAGINNDELPHGIYAGLAVYLLKTGTRLSMEELLSVNDTLKELQYPLYEKDNLLPDDRATALNIAYTIVDDLLKSGITENRLQTFSTEEISNWLQTNYEIELPKYQFFPYSSIFEYCIKQDSLTYYINRQYIDLILPENVFSTKYNVLTDWLIDNDKCILTAVEMIGDSCPGHLTIYMDNGKNAGGKTSYMIGSEIHLYSAGAFSSGYLYYLLHRTGRWGIFGNTMSELNVNISVYASQMWKTLFSGEATYYVYDTTAGDEKALYLQAMNLYNQKVSTETDSFDFWLYSDCFAALTTQKDIPFINMLQSRSFGKYIFYTYGKEAFMQLNKNSDMLIDGKNYMELSYLWIDSLKTFVTTT